mmetsp:Transcript_742/g.2590  ORF Transcript_742/g.2590 Transcript_742/m.2590 type:complete len:478 (-) Transcript_742:13-1446(-)
MRRLRRRPRRRRGEDRRPAAPRQRRRRRTAAPRQRRGSRRPRRGCRRRAPRGAQRRRVRDTRFRRGGARGGHVPALPRAVDADGAGARVELFDLLRRSVRRLPRLPGSLRPPALHGLRRRLRPRRPRRRRRARPSQWDPVPVVLHRVRQRGDFRRRRAADRKTRARRAAGIDAAPRRRRVRPPRAVLRRSSDSDRRAVLLRLPRLRPNLSSPRPRRSRRLRPRPRPDERRAEVRQVRARPPRRARAREAGLLRRSARRRRQRRADGARRARARRGSRGPRPLRDHAALCDVPVLRTRLVRALPRARAPPRLLRRRPKRRRGPARTDERLRQGHVQALPAMQLPDHALARPRLPPHPAGHGMPELRQPLLLPVPAQGHVRVRLRLPPLLRQRRRLGPHPAGAVPVRLAVRLHVLQHVRRGQALRAVHGRLRRLPRHRPARPDERRSNRLLEGGPAPAADRAPRRRRPPNLDSNTKFRF